MMDITAIRQTVRSAVTGFTELPSGNVDVRLAPSSFADGTVDFSVTVTLDPNWVKGRDPTEILDEWLSPDGPQSMKDRLEQDETIKNLVQVVVMKTSGHRLYQGQEGPARVGAEWTLRTLA